MTNLAQINTVPAETLKWAVIIGITLLSCAGIAVGIWAQMQKKSFAIDPQPLAVKPHPTEYNADFCEARHDEIKRRLGGHDAQIDQIWNVMRAEDKAIRQEVAVQFEKINRSLGRIEGHLGTKGTTHFDT